MKFIRFAAVTIYLLSLFSCEVSSSKEFVIPQLIDHYSSKTNCNQCTLIQTKDPLLVSTFSFSQKIDLSSVYSKEKLQSFNQQIESNSIPRAKQSNLQIITDYQTTVFLKQFKDSTLLGSYFASYIINNSDKPQFFIGKESIFQNSATNSLSMNQWGSLYNNYPFLIDSVPKGFKINSKEFLLVLWPKKAENSKVEKIQSIKTPFSHEGGVKQPESD